MTFIEGLAAVLVLWAVMTAGVTLLMLAGVLCGEVLCKVVGWLAADPHESVFATRDGVRCLARAFRDAAPAFAAAGLILAVTGLK